MVLIGWHGSGELIWRLNPAYRTTRLYCDSSWWQTEEYQRDDEGKVTQIKFANGPRYVDPVGFVTRAIPSGGMFDPTLGLCGPDAEDHDLSDAITNRGLNVITFCPSVWKAGHPVTIPQQLADPTRIPPFPIGDLDSLTWTFFHEYTHLVGASIFFPEGVIDVKNNRGGMCYGFPECSFLGGSRLATINADNYVLLALASYLYMYDWSDGTCRIP
ncbi:uncharacterized protein LY89DRAFT_691593 [Mollisia scopiformis]|uniref:Uncharacterized protein n=1 Tax=Mollisia scopiformis TaxID=149040 RepID=A0A132B665_MOLSC|nr:uncharacterized protein LY89DRAFT_691593 [Mollisia scopiformis]KUJ07489.1 hypothetical protein LY89DRAFT_691593 [Mollisia scopiformis]